MTESPSYTVGALMSSEALTFSDRVTVWRQLARVRLREFLQFDSTVAGAITGGIALGGALVCSLIGRHRRALELLTTAHRATTLRIIRAPIERMLKQPAAPGSVIALRVNAAYDEYLRSISSTEPHRQPRNLLGTRVMVVKSPAAGERGVVVMDYTYTFPIVARHFDLSKLCERYYIVLEPSWIGFCTPEILVYSRLPEPVFFETNEPVDIQFLSRVSKNFVHVEAQGNCWVDHRVFRPAEGVAKDIDMSMVSAWADYKRHAGVFAALGKLRRQGRQLRTLLIGYAGDGSLNRDDVIRQARYYGVADQIEIQENLAIEDVTTQLSRSKVHVLWSRREGFNRAIIEAMLTGVPGILRAGHNYGQHYPYINPQTGRFADESTLPDVLLHMTDHHHEYDPRGWVMANMTPQIATSRMNETIKRVALARGEAWSTDIVVRTVQLKRAPYWNGDDASRFAADYEYLGTLVR
jgi:glycosyltransferase involved in cell wall biosynthesis